MLDMIIGIIFIGIGIFILKKSLQKLREYLRK